VGSPDDAAGTDTNGIIAALLRDLASAQASTQSRWGYKRAAAAIRNLDAPIESYLQADPADPKRSNATLKPAARRARSKRAATCVAIS
jgi:hypothetical protein